MRAIALIIICLLVPWHSVSAAKGEKDKGEKWRRNTQLLPQYCKDRAKGRNTAEWKRWSNTFGTATIHIHHYCAGIYAQQEVRTSLDQGVRKRELGNVVHQMKYVGAHCGTDCVLYPELHTRWGWALAEQGEAAEAIQHYQLAIKAQPKYSQAYAQLSDLYLELKQPEEARKVLESGLEAKPKSRMLQRRLQELGKAE
jgi:tetratricopeptide (TPR) repeat protein